ncbi:MAG: hypothetical protein RMK57_02555 [Bryobacterales bacterium]|nr:hypothetical protein [Bryobacteraceae bacterium]MDW8353388.1 hypothetical protein [Bryobacterales bacterium]
MASRFAHPNAKSSAFLSEYRTDTVALITGEWKLIWREQADQAGLPKVDL